MKKHIFLIIILLVYVSESWAQKELKYKDVFENISSPDKSVAYNALLSFLNTEPTDLNANYQMAVLCMKKAKEADPLSAKDEVLFYLNKAKYYFSFANGIDDKEIRKNRKYYENIILNPVSGKIEFTDFQADFAARLKDMEEHESKLNTVLNFFELTQYHYYRSIELYEQICTKYPSVDALIINLNDETKSELLGVKLEFVKSIEHFKQYRDAIKGYPIKNYNQYWTVRPILKYGFDGLTTSNFLVQEVALWDFESWVNSIFENSDKNLLPVRKQVTEINKKLDIIINSLSANEIQKANRNDLRIPPQVIETFAKYDENALPLVLFQYKIAKINWIESLKSFNNVASQRQAFNLQANIYSLVISNKQECENKLVVLEKSITDEAILRYYSFVKETFGNKNGLTEYIENERGLNENLISQTMAVLRENYLKHLFNVQEKQAIAYKGSLISLVPQLPNFEKAEVGSYYTTAVETDENKHFYITGFVKQSATSVKAFIAKTNDTTSIAWLKIINIRAHIQKTFNDCGAVMSITPGRCWLIVNSSTQSVEDLLMFNTLFVSDTAGNELFTRKLVPETIPRKMLVNPATEQVIATYIGKDFHPFAASLQNGIIKTEKLIINSVQDAATWSTEIEMAGGVADIANIGSNMLVFSNFVSYTDYYGIQKESLAATAVNKSLTNVYTALLDKNGHLIRSSTATDKNSYFVTDTYRVNNELFNGTIMLGFKGSIADIDKYENMKSHQLYVGLSDAFGNIVYSNLK